MIRRAFELQAGIQNEGLKPFEAWQRLHGRWFGRWLLCDPRIGRASHSDVGNVGDRGQPDGTLFRGLISYVISRHSVVVCSEPRVLRDASELFEKKKNGLVLLSCRWLSRNWMGDWSEIYRRLDSVLAERLHHRHHGGQLLLPRHCRQGNSDRHQLRDLDGYRSGRNGDARHHSVFRTRFPPAARLHRIDRRGHHRPEVDVKPVSFCDDASA